MSERTSKPTSTPLTAVFGANAKVEILSTLAESDGPMRQVEIANEVGVSEATISRAKKDLLDNGFVNSVDGGLTCAEGVAETIRTLQNQL
jgi:predicted transcriptional regulator